MYSAMLIPKSTALPLASACCSGSRSICVRMMLRHNSTQGGYTANIGASPVEDDRQSLRARSGAAFETRYSGVLVALAAGEWSDQVDRYRRIKCYDSPRASGWCHRRSGNRLKSESVVTNVQPCSTATAACWASATSFPVAPAWRHIL